MAIALRAHIVVIDVLPVVVPVQEVRPTAVVTAIADVGTVTLHTMLEHIAPTLAVLITVVRGTLPVTRRVSNVLMVCVIRPK